MTNAALGLSRWLVGGPARLWIVLGASVALFLAGSASGWWLKGTIDAPKILTQKVNVAECRQARAEDTANANAAATGELTNSAARARAFDNKTNDEDQRRRAAYERALQEAIHVPNAKTTCIPAEPLLALFRGMRGNDEGAAGADRGGASGDAIDPLRAPAADPGGVGAKP